jgi:hypothetical protein
MGPEIPAGNEVIPQESQKSCSVWYQNRETGSVVPQPGEAGFSGRPGSGWRCFELRVYIWTSSMGKRRTRAWPGDAVSGSAAGPAPHAQRMMD